MALKTILACLTSEASASEVVAAASILARRRGAHLIGLHAMESLIVYPTLAMHIPGSVYADFTSSQVKAADDIEKMFRAQTDAEAFPCEWRRVKTESTTAAERIVESARAADLVVMAQENPDAERTDHLYIQQTVIRDSGRPVLVIPHEHKGEEIGKNILVGWSPTREATRAAHDVLGLAEDGAEVHLMSVTSNAQQDKAVTVTQNDLAAAISRQGFRTNTIHRQRSSDEIADILQREAFEIGADLIATGAFGHSRFYDFVIGAVSRTLLKTLKTPVMFSK